MGRKTPKVYQQVLMCSRWLMQYLAMGYVDFNHESRFCINVIIVWVCIVDTYCVHIRTEIQVDRDYSETRKKS